MGVGGGGGLRLIKKNSFRYWLSPSNQNISFSMGLVHQTKIEVLKCWLSPCNQDKKSKKDKVLAQSIRPK